MFETDRLDEESRTKAAEPVEQTLSLRVLWAALPFSSNKGVPSAWRSFSVSGGFIVIVKVMDVLACLMSLGVSVLLDFSLHFLPPDDSLLTTSTVGTST
jgi:hypothetical protein